MLSDGQAPTKADWSPARDPELVWPRSAKVTEMFDKLAVEAGRRWFVNERCDGCRCAEYADGPWPHTPFTPERGCPHGDNGYWDGVTGWGYALEQAGLTPRRPGDQNATASGLPGFGRNRQMVTAGEHHHPQIFHGRHVD